MNNSEHLRTIQTETARNLTESLEEWKNILHEYGHRLNTITVKEYNTIDEISLAIEDLEFFHSEVGTNDDALSDYAQDTKILLETLEENEAADLRVNSFQTFHQEWEALRGEVRLLSSSFTEMVTQFANEDALMIEWESKAMRTEQLLKIMVEVVKFCEEPATLTNYDEYLNSFNDLELKVMAQIAIVDSNLIEFKDLHENQLQIVENREKVKFNGESIIFKKSELSEKLAEAKKTVVTVVERMKMQDQNKENIRVELKRWQLILDQNNEILMQFEINEPSTHSDTLKAIDDLEAMLAQIDTYDADLTVFKSSSSEVVATDLVQVIKTFFKNWDFCQRKGKMQLTSFRTQLIQLEKNETQVITEWKEKVTKVFTLLDDSIADIRPYEKLPYKPIDFKDYLLQFKEVLDKVGEVLESVKGEKERGHHLVDNHQLQQQNRDVILADINSISYKERILQSSLMTAQSVYSILSDRVTVLNVTTRNITEAVEEWQEILDMYTERLDRIDKLFENGENDIHKTVELLTALFSEVKSHQERLDVFKADTALLIETVNSEQTDIAAPACELFFKNWDFNWSNTSERLTVMEIKIRDDLAASEKMAAEWDISSRFINTWLTKAEIDIKVYVKTGALEIQEMTEIKDTFHLRAEEFHISEDTSKELVTRLEEEGKEVSEQIEYYVKVLAEGSYKGLDEVQLYQERKTILDKKLLNAAILLDEVDADVLEVEVVRTTLISWSEVLRVETKSFEAIDLETNKQEALQLLIELIAEAEVKSAEVETFVISSTQTLDWSPFFKKSTAALKEEVLNFHVEWKNSITLLLETRVTLEKRIEEEHLIMTEWHHKTVVAEEVLTMTEEINVFAEAPLDLDDYDDYLSKFEELETKVLDNSSVVDESIGKGSEIYDTVSDDNREKIRSAVDAFTLKKSKMQETLMSARKTVVEIVELKRKQKQYEEEFHLSITEWRKFHEEWNETLNSCTIERATTVMETEIVISILENLLIEINSHDDKLDEFGARAEEILAALETEKSETWQAELSVFIDNHLHLKEEISIRITLLHNTLNTLMTDQQNTQALIDEWTPSVELTLFWLKDSEIECTKFNTLPLDHFDIHKFLVDYEGLRRKIDVKLEYIKEQKEHGSELITKLVEQANKDKVTNDIVLIEEGEEKLQLTLDVTKKAIEDGIKEIVFIRVNEFWERSPAIQKRMDEEDFVGPDFDIVIKQIQEMKLINVQTIHISFAGLLDPYKSNTFLQFLTEEDRIKIQSANAEWIKIKVWIDKRFDTLSRAEANWNDYKARKLDILEYLRDIDEVLKSVIGINLNDSEAVQRSLEVLLSVTEGMEARNDHVGRLSECADRLMELLITANDHTEEADPVYSSIHSEVAEVLDLWNHMLKKSGELKKKLDEDVETFESCYSLYQEVRRWVDGNIDVLSQFIVDESGKKIDTTRAKLAKRQSEIEEHRYKLHTVNLGDEYLSREYVLYPTYTWPGKGKVKVLNKDFKDAIEKLDDLNGFVGQVKLLSRRVRGSEMSGRIQDKSVEVSDRVRDGTKEMSVRARDKASEMSDRARDSTKEMSGRAKEKASEVSGRAKEKASEMSGRAKEKASEMSGRAKEKASEMSGRARDKASEMSGRAREKASEVSGRVRDSTKRKTAELKQKLSTSKE